VYNNGRKPTFEINNGEYFSFQPLQDRLDVYDDKPLNTKKPNITHFPPNFEPIPCKPLFFDLASNQLQFPSLSHRMEQKKANAGFTNYLKGWLWGSGSS
jgi:signal recognition particle subunit SRP68